MMACQSHSATANRKATDVTPSLKELDRKICESVPKDFAAGSALTLLDAQGQCIAEALESFDQDRIQTVAHAAFHEFSQAPAHREAARRWFAENKREAKKLRYVFDRFDGLARLNRLKQALSADGAPPNLAAEAPEENAASVPLELPQPGVELLFIEPNIHGEYPPAVVKHIQRHCQDRRYIFLAFPPKCGGTFIRDIVGRISGAGPNPFRPGHALGGRDVHPYLPMLAAQMLSPTGPKAFMTHAHMIAHHSNIQLLNLFRIKSVVMKRSIPDMLCSFADMVDTEGRNPDGSYNWSLLCGVHTDPSFLKLKPDARLDFLVHHQAPWYAQFYASWFRADRNRELPIHWASFEEFRTDPVATIVGILDFYGLADRAASVPGMIARAHANRSALRFNKGVSGRGGKLLSPEHLQHLHRLAAGYPDVDFVAEGLLPPLSK